MTLKVGFAQVAAPTTITTVDLVDAAAGFVSDVKAAIFFASSGLTNLTNGTNLRQAIGLNANSSPTTQACVAIYSQDAVVLGTTVARGRGSNAVGFGQTASNGASFSGGEAVVSSWLSNGARLNFTTAGTFAWLINGILFGGDIQAEVLSGSFANATPSDLTLTYAELTAAAEVLVIITPLAAEATASGGNRIAVAFYDVATSAIVSAFFHMGNALGSPTSTLGSIDNAQINNNQDTRTFTVLSVGATNLVIRQSTSNNAHAIYVLALRGTTSPLVASVGTLDTSTATGDAAEVTGMSLSPQALLTWATRFVSTPATSANNTGSTGTLGAAITNSGGIKQGTAGFHESDNVSTTVSKSQTSVTKALSIPSTAGASDVEATVASFDSGGVTLNYSNINATAYKALYMALGQAASVGGFAGLQNLEDGIGSGRLGGRLDS